MKNGLIKKIGILFLSGTIAFGSINYVNAANGNAKNSNTNVTTVEEQNNSLAMLNYLTVLTKEINASQNSKVYLDNAYSSIVNNINPNAVDEDTMYEIRLLLGTIDSYQSIETKRERLEYIYEQNQANAIEKAIPNPVSVLNVVQSKNIYKALVSVVYMAVDSVSSYNSYISDVDTKYYQDSWELDDEATENLQESREDAFSYMVEMCRTYGLDGKLAMNEDSVDNFVSYENKSVAQRIRFLEDNKETYKAYGKYWLVLAESYYDNGDYEKCIDALDTYEDLGINIFRYDRDFAKALSKGIEAVSEVYNGEEYNNKLEHWLGLIEKNINGEDDWDLRYFAAEGYMDLYSKTDDKSYLQKAFELARENVNYLTDEQIQKNDEYISDIVELKTSKTNTKEQNKEIKNYNNWLKDERKTALPPVYQPLVVNCELLFAIADKLEIDDSAKKEIDNILHDDNEPLFLVEQIDNKYWFFNKNKTEQLDIDFDGTSIEIPACYVSQGSTIKVYVISNDKSTEYSDWTLDKVKRDKSSEVSNYTAIYKSEKIKKVKYSDGDTIKITIIPDQQTYYEKLTYTFEAKVITKLHVNISTKFELVK